MAAPADYQSPSQARGATALAAVASPAPAQVLDRSRRPAQTSLFKEEPPRVVPIAHSAKRMNDALLAETAEIRPPELRPKPKPAVRKQPPSDSRGEQSTLDFLPPAHQAARTLKTTVEAVIYCDAPVASPMHRAMAALLDASMIFLGFGIFLVIFQVFGGLFPLTKQNIAIFAGALVLIAMSYGFTWALWGRETAGMRWTGLRLINFNGFAPDGKSRALRLVGCWLSFCSGLIGIAWALVDEENLTWHDHMSKTFPTLRETNTNFFRQRI